MKVKVKVDRLLGIITVLLQKEKATAPYLAEKFEVSRRTILRDIDDICKAGIPIITKQGGNGGISILDGYKLDKNLLTGDEMQNIIAGLKSLDSVSTTSTINRLVEKLLPNKESIESQRDNKLLIKDSIIIDLSSHYKNSLSEKIELIKSAINQSKLVKFDYYNVKGKSSRSIEPYFITFKWSAWYVFGYCLEREDFRTFKLNRLWELTCQEEVYIPRDVPMERRNLDNCFSDNQKVQILFDSSSQYRLIDEYGLNCFSTLENGKLLLEVGYTNEEYMISWILGFGDKAEVISPIVLREKISAIIRNIAEIYF